MFTNVFGAKILIKVIHLFFKAKVVSTKQHFLVNADNVIAVSLKHAKAKEKVKSCTTLLNTQNRQQSVKMCHQM